MYGGLVNSLAANYSDRVEVKVYTVGSDFEYLPKYGSVTKSMLIINESKAITNLSKNAVKKAFEEAIRTA